MVTHEHNRERPKEANLTNRAEGASALTASPEIDRLTKIRAEICQITPSELLTLK
jgi:hypothetical protein